jgi:hypothetical protein
MGKSHNKNYDKEFSKVQKLANENKQLKKEVSRLRKELTKLEFRYENLDDLTQQQYEEEYPVTAKDLKTQQNKWKCHKCSEGILKIIIVNKMGKAYYLRKCNFCSNKTKLQPYTKEVEGVK